jgi:pectate lyase-like protein
MSVNGFFRRYWHCLLIFTCCFAVTAPSCSSGKKGDASTLLIITSVTSSSLSGTGAIISWNTNRPADSQVEYGATTNYGNVMSLATMQTSHSLSLIGLTPSTLYHYRVKSKDESGNVSTSGDQTFTTTTTIAPFPIGGVDEFVGPFPSWKNVKDYGARGDGTTDDTTAIQQGLDQLSNESGPIKTLYFPRGSYRISRTLRVHNTIFVNIIGEDPDLTTILWGSTSAGIMLDIDGVAYSRFNRLTFDGRNIASVAVDQSKSDNDTPHFDTGNEYAEDVFKDVQYGIRGGNEGFGAAETSVVRSRFIRNSRAGIILKNFNALDWWIRFSYFEGCATGVTNDPGAGNFHVYNSFFKGSTVADISIRNTGGFGIRNNYSVGSRVFFLSPTGGGNNGALTTIQGNTILDTTDTAAIQIGDLGPVQVYDNFIRSRSSSGPAITLPVADALVFDNTFSITSNQISASGRRRVDGNSNGAIAASEPVIPFKYVTQNRRVFEVPAGASGSTIQQNINQAGALCGQRPIIHLPAANYQVNSSLVVPANCDMQIVGDGGATSLTWGGSNGGTVMRLQGPSRAILRDFRVQGSSQGVVNGIVIENADQPNSRVYMQGAFANSTTQNGLLVDGLSSTRVDLRDFMHQGTSGSGIRINGGPQDLGGRTTLIGGATSSNDLTYEITGGRFVAKDVWYETSSNGNKPYYMKLSGNAIATLDQGKIYTNAAANSPVIDIQNFNGKGAFIGLDLARNGDTSDPEYTIRISGTGRGSILGLGLQGRSSSYFFRDPATPADARLINSRWYNVAPNTGSTSVTDIGSPDLQFLRDMLSQTRGANLSNEYEMFPAGITDVRIYRVYAERTIVGFQIKR